TIALFIGLAAVNLARPGIGVGLSASAKEGESLATKSMSWGDVLEHIVPTSIFKAAADNEVLQIVFWSIVFAVSLTQLKGPQRQIVLDGLDALAEVMFKFTNLVMKYAPIGVGAAVAVTVGKSGLAVLSNLAELILTLYGALVVFVLIVLLPVA